MDIKRKLAILADAAKYDASCASSGSKRERPAGGLGNTEGMGICHSYTPDGRCISLLKILLTNVCIWDCAFCVNRKSSDIPRARFRPEEVVKLTVDFYKRNYIEGLFLSSGIIRNADYTMEQLILVAKKLREEEKFGGYIHLKAVPGASQLLIKEAGLYADRLSANLELPDQESLDALAPDKTIGEIESTMSEIKEEIDESRSEPKAPAYARAGQSTQIVVGASPSSDSQILSRAEQLYEKYGLRRIYYSAFSPAKFTDPTLNVAAAPVLREHRLYQADWLLRNYGFKANEINAGMGGGNLDLTIDPKLAWALQHRSLFPVDVNRASRSLLCRVPGIGTRNADRIVKIRRFHRLRMDDLARINVSLHRAKWFIVTADDHSATLKLDNLNLRQLIKPAHFQPSLFDSIQPASTITGEF